LTEKEKNNKDVISVIIPVCKADEQYLDRTVESLYKNAVGKVQVLSALDKNNEGLRVLVNRLAKEATGKYIMKLDAHCAMSPEWDARFKASCGPEMIVKPMLDTLNLKTWRGVGRDMGFITVTPEMRNQHLFQWKPLERRQLEEETLSMLGCCFMMEKAYFDRFGGCDESLGKWGALGLEWALNTWLTGGKLIIRTDSVCYHYFRLDRPFEIDDNVLNEKFKSLGLKWRSGLGKGQTKSLPWLFEKFADYLDANIRLAQRDQRTSARYVADEPSNTNVSA
tara:strand:- start:977 stop:1816 length:840 start_codon:yes stop_codon:yes gene_type:complete